MVFLIHNIGLNWLGIEIIEINNTCVTYTYQKYSKVQTLKVKPMFQTFSN